jgi:hypothetical protein
MLSLRGKTRNRTLRNGLGAGLLFVALLALPRTSKAGTNSASLSITMDVQPSISLVFQNNPNVGQNGYCPLSNAGTSTVGLDLGIGSWPGNDSSSCVGSANYVFLWYYVYSAFDVVVTKANSTSASYNLQVALGSPAPSGFNFYLNGVGGTALSTTLQPISGQSTEPYATRVTETLYILVPITTPAQTVSQSIEFVATAN